MPFCVIKSRTIKFFVLIMSVALLLCISFEGFTSASVWFGHSSRLVPIYNVDTSEAKVAISFDAACGADDTKNIIEILKEYNVSATFFLVGFWVDKYPEMVKYIDESGFEIGTHSNTHPDMAKLDGQEMKNELSLSMEKIKKITGKDVKLFRAPYGSYNNTLIEVASELGLKVIQWDVDSLDWKDISAAQVTDRVMKKTKNGSIILMHNSAKHVTDNLRLSLDWLKMKGYTVTNVGNLVYENNYTIDANGVQHKS